MFKILKSDFSREIRVSCFWVNNDHNNFYARQHYGRRLFSHYIFHLLETLLPTKSIKNIEILKQFNLDEFIGFVRSFASVQIWGF